MRVNCCRSVAAMMAIALPMGGCFRYVPVEVLVLDSLQGNAISNAEVKPEYMGGLELQFWPDRSPVWTDPSGRAVVRITENPSNLTRNGHVWTGISVSSAGYRRGGTQIEFAQIQTLRTQVEREHKPASLLVKLNPDESR